MLERNGRPIAIGTPLNGDGRILTALSPLTHGNQIVARYPEGQLVPVKLSHSNRAWDLALLTPEVDRRSGLKAAREAAPASGAKLQFVSYVRDKQLGPVSVTIKAKSTLRGGDSAELPDALELSVAPKPTDVGAPIVNDQGEVVAIVARACAATDQVGCTLVPYAAPVSAVRDFLRSAPPRRRSPSLGLEVVAFDAGVARGVRIASVASEGPAANSGLRAGPPGVGDVVLAVDGTPVATAAAFAEAIDTHGPATVARLTVLSDGHYREVLLAVSAPADMPVAGPAPAAPAAPARNDRVFRSNPAGSAPLPPTPTSVPNPYR